MNKPLSPFLIVTLLSALPIFAAGLKQAPDVTTRDISGNMVSLAAMYAKGPVIVDFWSTCCPPCMAELKAVKKLQETYAAKGLTVLAISEDGPGDAAKVRQMVQAKKWPFVIVIDNAKELYTRFQAKDMPTTFLIGTDGKIHARHAGYVAGDEKKLESEIKTLLGTAEPQPQAQEQQ